MSDWKNPLPLRILVMADFGVDGVEETLGVTSGTYSEVLAKLAPKAAFSVPDALGIGGNHEVVIDLSTTAGFHPDTAVAAIPALSLAADLRGELEKIVSGDGDASAAGGLADRAEGEKVARALSDLDGADAEKLAAALDRLDAVISAQVDEVLHHPELQRFESAWRGLSVLLDGAGDGGSVVVEILPTRFEDLREKFKSRVFEPEYAGTEVPLTALILDFDFDHRAHLLGPLEEIADHCRALQVAVIAGTGPGLFGLKTLVHLTALSDLTTRLSAPVYKRMQQFQTTDASRWAALTLNRVLLRNLYEPGMGGVDRFSYTEIVEAGRPEKYLWGRAGWLVGLNLARSFVENGHCAEISGHDGPAFLQGLPVRPVPVTKDQQGWCSVEVPLSEEQAQGLTHLGLTTLSGNAGGNFAYFPLVTNLYRAVPGSMTISSAMSHQLFAAHVSHYSLLLLDRVPEGGTDEAVSAHFTEGITALLGPMGGEGAVAVDVAEREGGGRTARIHVTPELKIQEKDVVLSFELPV